MMLDLVIIQPAIGKISGTSESCKRSRGQRLAEVDIQQPKIHGYIRLSLENMLGHEHGVSQYMDQWQPKGKKWIIIAYHEGRRLGFSCLEWVKLMDPSMFDSMKDEKSRSCIISAFCYSVSFFYVCNNHSETVLDCDFCRGEFIFETKTRLP